MNDLRNVHSPPPPWVIIISLKEGGNLKQLRQAHLILSTFLTKNQYQCRRIKRGIQYTAQFEDKGVRRSILATIEYEVDVWVSDKEEAKNVGRQN